MNNQVQLQQSQGGGGGFARGTIFKGGKNWKIGGMAANAAYKGKMNNAMVVPTPSQIGGAVGQSDAPKVPNRQASSNYAGYKNQHGNEMARTHNTNFN